jgi:hypothetical protein
MTAFQQFIDAIPIGGIFLAFSVVALIVSEGGYRLGRWWQNRKPEEKEGPTPMIVGSLLALMAFLLAITTGMASERFNARRALVLAEANAMSTAYLRAGYLSQPESAEVRQLLRLYVPLRIAPTDVETLTTNIERSAELQDELWLIAEGLARETPESDVLALFLVSLNEVIDLHQQRIMAAVYGRVPVTILLLLLSGSVLTLAMVGYNAGLTRRRSPLTAVVLIVILGAVITVVIDLDRPQGGFLEVSQRPLVELGRHIGASLPGESSSGRPVGQ